MRKGTFRKCRLTNIPSRSLTAPPLKKKWCLEVGSLSAFPFLGSRKTLQGASCSTSRGGIYKNHMPWCSPNWMSPRMPPGPHQGHGVVLAPCLRTLNVGCETMLQLEGWGVTVWHQWTALFNTINGQPCFKKNWFPAINKSTLTLNWAREWGGLRARHDLSAFLRIWHRKRSMRLVKTHKCGAHATVCCKSATSF